MTKAAQTAATIPPASSTPPPHNPALDNRAVFHCCCAWTRAFDMERERNGEGGDIRFCFDAQYAYRRVLPPLTGYRNICDFIACVAHGILILAIGEKEGSKLLYAAQVALAAVRKEKKTAEEVEK